MNTHNAPLRRGWTTGACAAGAARAAFEALLCGHFPDPVEVKLPGGRRPSFALARQESGDGWALAGIIKDAGDDPDVTHGALICSRVRRTAPGSGITFRAGPGVGTVTRPGLPLPAGEPAINPKPREIIRTAITEAAKLHGAADDVEIEVSIPNGEIIAQKTLNPRLGIVGGLSILGTTGIVIPYSCSAWIHGIHNGIDVARAEGLTHIAGATGTTSEAAILRLHQLPELALIDMGDFVGGMLKHLRTHPVERVSIAGGFGKMTKLAQGLLDLHSKRGSVDMEFLSRLAGQDLTAANTALEALHRAPDLPEKVAALAWKTASATLDGAPIQLEIVIFDREGGLLARTPFTPV